MWQLEIRMGKEEKPVNIGALIIRIGFSGPLHYNHNNVRVFGGSWDLVGTVASTLTGVMSAEK